ncbi:MAG: hypothetical protein IPO40_03725 [Fibrobacteres bacterium]|nr:hypothetical protein [Fibrobacterota bacterium]
MRHLFADIMSPKTQEYLYDCLEAATKRLLALDGTRIEAEYGWHSGEKEVNIIGVRGMRYGFVHNNQSGVFDDTIFVARIITDSHGGRKKEVWPFEVTLDYSTGSAPILLEGAYKYTFGRHLQTCSTPQNLRSGYGSDRNYRALVNVGTHQARDYNQNNQADSFERIEYNGVAGINIHYGGAGDQVNRNSAGCQTIHFWSKYIQFMRLLEQDGTIQNTSGSNELEPSATGPKNRNVIYYLMQGGFYEHFVATQSAVPLGEPRSRSFGKVDPFTVHDLSASIERSKIPANFPVSSNGTWHSGVHIPVQNGKSAVCAAMPGRIVAARLFSKPDQTGISNNFILMHHDIDGCSFFSLYMHVDIDARQYEKIEWLNRRYVCYRAKCPLTVYGRNLVLTTASGMKSAAFEAELNRHKLRQGIGAGELFWEVPSPKSPNPLQTTIARDTILPAGLEQKSELESRGYQWVVCEKHPQGCWIQIADHPGGAPKNTHAEYIDSFSELLGGKIVPFYQPVLPGDIIAFPGEMMEEKGVHFEVFSQNFDIILNALAQGGSDTGDTSLGGVIPAWVQGVFITELYQGKNYVLPGRQTTFAVKSLSTGSNETNLGQIRWKIRILNESGIVLKESNDLVGRSVSFPVPTEESYHWCEVVAQPYLGQKPDPRLAIHRWILPGEMTCLSDFAVEHLESKEGVKDRSKGDFLSSILLSAPWKKRENDASIAKRNFLRYSELSTKYQWWDEAIKNKTPHLFAEEIPHIFYYHPVRFLQALPFLAKGLIGVSQTPAKAGQTQYTFTATKPAAPIKVHIPGTQQNGNNYVENGQIKRLGAKANTLSGLKGME